MCEVRKCSRDGCERPSDSRGMCATHYRNWLRTTTVDTKIEDSRGLVLGALPGTRREIAQETGLCYETVARLMRILRDANLVHIKGQLPPKSGVCCRYVDVFVAGPGQDRRVSKRKKRATKLARTRELRIRNGHAKSIPDPLLMLTAGRQAVLA